MSTTIEGKAKIWAKDFDGRRIYSISVSTKDQNGNWANAYQPVRFRKGVQVENGSVIDFRGFATVSIGKEKNSVIWQITEFKLAEDRMAAPQSNDFAQLTNDDIPF